MLSFATAFLAELPNLVALGANLTVLIPEFRKVVTVLAGDGTISVADADAMLAQVNAAESAWAVEVAKAKSED